MWLWMAFWENKEGNYSFQNDITSLKRFDLSYSQALSQFEKVAEQSMSTLSPLLRVAFVMLDLSWLEAFCITSNHLVEKEGKFGQICTLNTTFAHIHKCE